MVSRPSRSRSRSSTRAACSTPSSTIPCVRNSLPPRAATGAQLEGKKNPRERATHPGGFLDRARVFRSVPRPCRRVLAMLKVIMAAPPACAGRARLRWISPMWRPDVSTASGSSACPPGTPRRDAADSRGRRPRRYTRRLGIRARPQRHCRQPEKCTKHCSRRWARSRRRPCALELRWSAAPPRGLGRHPARRRRVPQQAYSQRPAGLDLHNHRNSRENT